MPPSGVKSVSCSNCFSITELKPIPVSKVHDTARQCWGCDLLLEAIRLVEDSITVKNKTIGFYWIAFSNVPSTSTIIRLYLEREAISYDLFCGLKSPSLLVSDPAELKTIREWPKITPRLGLCQPRDYTRYAKIAQQWIDECATSHEGCQRTNLAPLPRRVIDVGHKEAFLSETRGQSGRYAALSHCWGDSQPLKTTHATLNSRLGRLVWSQLPVAFQECIYLVRALGIRYLWIDSLCILQDDQDEWEVESARMASIFENSYITIVMHQAQTNALCLGAITSFTLPTVMKVNGRIEEDQDVHFRLHLASDRQPFELPVDNDRLSSRGWCFQEKLLANRLLHCTRDELIFECSGTRSCECSDIHSHFKTANMKSEFVKDSVSTSDWLKMVRSFNQTQFTFEGDVLPALSGIANRVSDSGQYYAGMWEKGLAQSLAWYSTVLTVSGEQLLPRGPNKYLAPTFSWPTVVGGKDFLHFSVADGSTTPARTERPSGASQPNIGELVQTFEIVSISCEPSGNNPLGALSAGRLQLRGRMLYASLINVFERPMSSDVFIKHALEPVQCLWGTLFCPGVGHYIFHPDSYDVFEMKDWKNRHARCIQLFQSPSNQQCYGLVLLKTGGNKFLRVGLFASIEKRYFEAKAPDIIDIV